MTTLPGYVLSENTANRVRQITQAAPETVGDGSGVSPRRLCGWVRCTSSTASSGWYPAIRTTYLDGAWADAEDVCEMQDVNGNTLTSGQRYWGEQTGTSATNKIRYLITKGGGGGGVNNCDSTQQNAVCPNPGWKFVSVATGCGSNGQLTFTTIKVLV